MRRLFSVVLVLFAFGAPLYGQGDVPSNVTFVLKRAWLEQLLTSGPTGHSVGARWTPTFQMGDHSKVHALGADCELHAAAKLPGSTVIGTPAGIVVEPPNICKLRVPQLASGGTTAARWIQYFDQHVTGSSCTVGGFPRIFSEHAAAGGTDAPSSNPDHVVEIHPVISLTCNGETVNFLPNLKYVDGMRAISDASASACLDQRKLFVRQRGPAATPRYEFLEEGAKGGAGRCGNFVIVDAHIDKSYIRTLSNGGDHVALARVWIGDDGPFPLKIYTYAGTPPDIAVAKLLNDPNEEASTELKLHGLLTYDYFTIAQVLQEDRGGGVFDWRSAAALKDFVEVSHPLSLVVFGKVP